ncbi:alpha-hydroxy-acid oxidizing protein [Acinetobacter sp. yr461]|uniref:alpha-hydroxy-acid oxidizing protein n=1 Tax=Acinetobacter sp. yr461 TaxID=1761742 RepID=UPI0008B3B7D8|nr:alpha-hydroxy-acid oxidizing protein [Acinetobacter sp. yr461]SEO25279.1 (S)-mandelate dehydrogenase [Acinetobacter sp. yr461]
MSRKPINVEDYRQQAKARLPSIIFDYLDGGAEDEKGLKHNRSVFDKWRFRPKRFIDISHRDISCNLFNKKWDAPFAIAPTGLNSSFWPKGDFLLASSAAKANIPFILSTASNMSIEEVAQSCDGEKWFQLYVVHEELAVQMVRRAFKAGYTTLIITLDVGVNGYRERDIRNEFGLPLRFSPSLVIDGMIHPAWALQFIRAGMPQLANFITSENHSLEVQAALMSRQMDTRFNLDSLKRIRELWPHTLLVKGIVRTDDAQSAINCGADGVILSNHGGRQLDCSISPMETLYDVSNSIDRPVLIDSGFRRGSDIVKALCLGASMVCLGRATLYGLAAKGERGVDDVIQLLKQDVDRTLAQIGCPSAKQLDTQFITGS